jgi:hypothetical protein
MNETLRAASVIMLTMTDLASIRYAVITTCQMPSAPPGMPG